MRYTISMDAIKTYIKYKANPDNDGKRDTHFCQEYELAYPELQKIKKEFPSWGKDALDLRREQYAERMTLIDSALFAAATSGDTKAAELIYRRFDNFNPRVVEQTNNYYNFADIVKAASTEPPKKVTHKIRKV